jgi:hypothetical protein
MFTFRLIETIWRLIEPLNCAIEHKRYCIEKILFTLEFEFLQILFEIHQQWLKKRWKTYHWVSER